MPCGADITSLCPKTGQREVPTLPSAPNLVCCFSTSSRPCLPSAVSHCLLPETVSNGIKALLRFGFFIIAACTVLDSVLFVALGYRFAKAVLFPVDPAKLETPSTYINFDLLYRNGTKTSSQFPPIRALPRALAQVSSREPDKVYPQWPVSFLAPYGSVPQNDRRLLVDPEVNLLLHHLDSPPW
jgi:hypothetical protein